MQERRHGGMREGLARGLSAACLYGLEAHKTMLQVHGRGLSGANMLEMMVKGMFTSAITSSVVFGSYFSVYHSIGPANFWAGPVSAVATSVIKIPLSNTIRLMQAGLAKNVVDAGRKIVQARRVRGLYNGYTASVAEDIIEFDLRTRMYSGIRSRVPDQANPWTGLSIGAVVGMFAAWITTPFDTIRAHMAIEAAGLAKRRSVMKTAAHLYKTGGVSALYRGATIRAMSNAMKHALFFMFYESITIV